MRPVGLIVFCAMLAIGSAGSAKDGLSSAITPLLDCRKVADRDARLACFDRESATVAMAIDHQDIVVADHKEIAKARRSLFGFALPGIDIFNKDRTDGDAKSEQGVNVIDATIASVSQDPYGHWSFVLDDGARWRQIDEMQIPRDPKRGMPIHIRRAAMGSFMANVDKQIGVRVRRVN